MRARRVLLALFLLAAPAARAQVGADWTAATGGSIRPGYDLNPCSAANSGALRYNTTVNQFQACYGSGGWATLADASGTTPFYTDRITSGTAGVFVSDTGIINFRTSGVTTGYLDASGLLVVPGISSTGVISATNLYLQPTYTHPYYVPATKFAAIYSGGDLNNSFILATTGSYTFFGARNNTMALSTVRDASGSPDDIVIQHANLTSTITSLVLKGTSGWVAVGSGRWIDPSASLHVSGTTRITSWTAINANVTATAPLDVYGTVSATAFVGNGSGLTGVTGDRITSGTAGVFVSNTGVINFRTGGVTTGYFDASGLLVTPGISITSAYGISSTSGSFSGTSTTLRVSQNGSILNYSPNLRTVALFENTSSAGAAIDILAQSTGTSGVFFSKPGGMGVSSLSYDHALSVMKFYLGGGTYGAWTTTGLLVGINNSATPATASTTLHVSGTLMTTSWTGINVSGKPNAPLEVSGTISATAFVGNGAGLTGLSAGDRITSGTAGVFVSNTGVINFHTGGVTTGYFDASGLLVAPGISITTANGISSTNGYFSGAVVNAPQANAGTSIDWSRSNVQSTSSSCGAFTFTNMQDGGVYSLTVKGTTAGTCSFSQSGLTFRMPPNHGSVSTGTMTFYTFTRSGSDVMVNWMPGY